VSEHFINCYAVFDKHVFILEWTKFFLADKQLCGYIFSFQYFMEGRGLISKSDLIFGNELQTKSNSLKIIIYSKDNNLPN
jgi:hypothetical protein